MSDSRLTCFDVVPEQEHACKSTGQPVGEPVRHGGAEKPGQEYAVDDYDELTEYLGPKIVDRDGLTLDNEILSDPTRLLEALEEHLLGAETEA